MIKGLKKYLNKYGKHFVKDLVPAALGCSCKLTSSAISKYADNQVWYNTTNSTIGDILFSANLAYCFKFCKCFSTKNKCINYALSIAQNYDYKDVVFTSWLKILKLSGKDFDFSKYIIE